MEGIISPTIEPYLTTYMLDRLHGQEAYFNTAS